MTDKETECALRAAVIAYTLDDGNVKLGSEGLMTHYDILTEIVEESFDKFPHDYDWEEHDGEDWDIEIQDFVADWLKFKYGDKIPTWEEVGDE